MSRQREYQKRKIAQGLCSICGKRPLFTKIKCKPCSEKVPISQIAERLKRRQEAKKKKLEIMRQLREGLLPFARIDPTFEFVKFRKLLFAIAKKAGVHGETLRRKYSRKQFLENKSILKM